MYLIILFIKKENNNTEKLYYLFIKVKFKHVVIQYL